MPIPDQLYELYSDIRVRFMSADSFTVPGQAASTVLKEMSRDQLLSIIEIFDDLGVDFDLSKDGSGRDRLTPEMHSYVLRMYIIEYLASFWRDDSEVAAEETRRMATRASNMTSSQMTGAMHTCTPLPVMGRDGNMYIPEMDGDEFD